MILSERILKKAPNEVQNFFANEFDQLQNAPKNVLLWIREYVNLTEEEENEINNLLELNNNISLNNIRNCFSVSNSIYIFNSNEIKDSKWVIQSKKITNSERVRDSSVVINSEDVCSGIFITNSLKIYSSKNVTNSVNIVKSDFIINSNSILLSKNISNSQIIAMCNDCKNVYFSSGCENLKNSLFCYNINNDDYLVFNKKVEPEIFELILSQFQQLCPKEINFIKWDNEVVIKNSKIPIDFRPSNYLSLDDYFCEWMTTLPGFNSEIAYFLTLKKSFQ